MKYLAIIAALALLVIGATFTLQKDTLVVNNLTVVSQETNDNADNTDEQQTGSVTQDSNYCLALLPNTGNAANSTFFVTELASGDTIADNYELRGCVVPQGGTYFWTAFEGQVGTYELRASDNTLLANGVLPASDQLNWQSLAIAGDPIPYETTVSFSPGSYTSGTMIFFNENPSGEAVNAASTSISVTF